MVKCKAAKLCFYGGKRYRDGELVNFDGDKKDLPSHLVEIEKEEKKEKTTKS